MKRSNPILAGLFTLLLFSPVVEANEGRPAALPEPLTLEYALSSVDEMHPQLLIAHAAQQQRQAALQAADANSGIYTTLSARARWIGLPEGANGESNTDDHAVSLSVRKRLYDFGRSQALEEAARAEVQGSKYRLTLARQLLKEHIMRAYFDVMLADIRFLRENEKMAVVFVSKDRISEQVKLGQSSEFELVESEAVYQQTRRNWVAAQSQQRVTRSRLAQALNRPGQLPATLAEPELEQIKRERPEEASELIQLAKQYNPRLLSLHQAVEAGRERVRLARSNWRPSLDAELALSNYSRELPSRDTWRAGVILEMPIGRGGNHRADIVRAEAELSQRLGELRQAEMEVEQAVLESWSALDVLRVRREQAWANYDFRELYLDRSRTLYEQELKTDLGDSMVQLTDAQYEVAASGFDIAMSWMQLEHLIGAQGVEQLRGDSRKKNENQ